LSRDVAFAPKKAGWFRPSETEFLRSGEVVHRGKRAVSSSSGLVYHGHFPEPKAPCGARVGRVRPSSSEC
jgi:hypothetical protein